MLLALLENVDYLITTTQIVMFEFKIEIHAVAVYLQKKHISASKFQGGLSDPTSQDKLFEH